MALACVSRRFDQLTSGVRRWESVRRRQDDESPMVRRPPATLELRVVDLSRRPPGWIVNGDAFVCLPGDNDVVITRAAIGQEHDDRLMVSQTLLQLGEPSP